MLRLGVSDLVWGSQRSRSGIVLAFKEFVSKLESPDYMTQEPHVSMAAYRSESGCI